MNTTTASREVAVRRVRRVGGLPLPGEAAAQRPGVAQASAPVVWSCRFPHDAVGTDASTGTPPRRRVGGLPLPERFVYAVEAAHDLGSRRATNVAVAIEHGEAVAA